MVEPRGNAVGDCLLKLVVIEHCRENEGGELRRALRNLFRFLADARPYRIEAANTGRELGLMLGHGKSPGSVIRGVSSIGFLTGRVSRPGWNASLARRLKLSIRENGANTGVGVS